MGYKIPRPKRCTECKKIISQRNMSGLCEFHSRKKHQEHKRLIERSKCCNCAELTDGKMMILLGRNGLKSFCQNCFNSFTLKSVKEIKAIIKKNKYGVTRKLHTKFKRKTNIYKL